MKFIATHRHTQERENSWTRNLKRGDEINFSFPSFAHYNSIFFRSSNFIFMFSNLILLHCQIKKIFCRFLEATESRIFSCSLHCRGDNINCFTISIDNEFTLDSDAVCSVSDGCAGKYCNCSWRRNSCTAIVRSNHGKKFQLVAWNVCNNFINLIPPVGNAYNATHIMACLCNYGSNFISSSRRL